jgi:hypothetical protein
MQIDELIGKYVELRDKKAEIKAAYTEKAAKIDAVLDKIEGKLLETFTKSGTESVRTEFGTAYKSTVVSCTTADKSVFLKFVQDNDAWPLLDARPLKSAIVEYQEQHQNIPPGLNWSSEVVVNVRRA